MSIDRLFCRGEWLQMQLADGVLKARFEYAATRIAHRWLIAARNALADSCMGFISFIDEDGLATFPCDLAALRESVARTKTALGMSLMVGMEANE